MIGFGGPINALDREKCDERASLLYRCVPAPGRVDEPAGGSGEEVRDKQLKR